MAPYWDAPSASQRARVDLWLRESGQMSVHGREWGAILSAAGPAPIGQAAQELAQQINAAIHALGDGIVSLAIGRSGSATHWRPSIGRGARAGQWRAQTVVRFHELLDEFGQLASSARAMSRDEAIHLVHRASLTDGVSPCR